MALLAGGGCGRSDPGTVRLTPADTAQGRAFWQQQSVGRQVVLARYCIDQWHARDLPLGSDAAEFARTVDWHFELPGPSRTIREVCLTLLDRKDALPNYCVDRWHARRPPLVSDRTTFEPAALDAAADGVCFTLLAKLQEEAPPVPWSPTEPESPWIRKVLKTVDLRALPHAGSGGSGDDALWTSPEGCWVDAVLIDPMDLESAAADYGRAHLAWNPDHHVVLVVSGQTPGNTERRHWCRGVLEQRMQSVR